MSLKTDLYDKCISFNVNDGSFSSIVENAILEIPELFSLLESKFDVNEATVYRWAKGSSAPLPKFQKLVVLFICEQIKKD